MDGGDGEVVCVSEIAPLIVDHFWVDEEGALRPGHLSLSLSLDALSHFSLSA